MREAKGKGRGRKGEWSLCCTEQSSGVQFPGAPRATQGCLSPKETLLWWPVPPAHTSSQSWEPWEKEAKDLWGGVGWRKPRLYIYSTSFECIWIMLTSIDLIRWTAYVLWCEMPTQACLPSIYMKLWSDIKKVPFFSWFPNSMVPMDCFVQSHVAG